MKTLKEFDQKYITALEAIPETLAEIKQKISTDYLFDNRTEEVSDALINRLKVYYESNQKIKNILNKGYLSNAADFLVESVLFYLHLYLQKHKSHLQAHSEKDILIEKWVDETGKKKKRVIRPDITIMHGKTVYAIIVCKTQLGWKRINWELDFINCSVLLNI
ncbi:MAG: hypothetical protein JNL13_04810, partial [Chitinophagaceae bacterium]|nr:hypothetical protein [Chitinophagaceae bacterium]